MRLAALVLMLMGAAGMVIAGFMVHAMVQASVADATLRVSVDNSLRNAFLVFVNGIIAFVLAVVTVISSRMDKLRYELYKRAAISDQRLRECANRQLASDRCWAAITSDLRDVGHTTLAMADITLDIIGQRTEVLRRMDVRRNNNWERNEKAEAKLPSEK